MKMIIVGGGIGGLTTALCGLAFGHQVMVLEKAEAFAEVGAGIQLSPNAMRVFTALGLTQKLLSRGFQPRAIETRLGHSGRTIFRVPVNDQTWGAPYLHIHRADLIDVLSTALLARYSGALCFGKEVQSFENREASVTVICSSGERFSGDVLIDAAGIKSPLRSQILLASDNQGSAPRFTGNIAWRCTVRTAALSRPPPASATAWMGRGKHAVTYYLRGGESVNFVGVVEQRRWTDEAWTSRGERSDLISDFADWDSRVTDILQACDPDAVYKWALFDRPPLNQWTHKRATLLGDSAHPMLPFMAQGAAMSIEDGWVLAKNLAHAPNVEIALQRYAQERMARTYALHARSRANQKIFHRKTALTQFAQYGPMWIAGHLLPNIVRKKLDWIYGFDVVGPI